MKTAAQTTFAERAGRALGRLWRGGVRLERKVQDWLVTQGLTPGVANAALMVVKLVAIGLLVYAVFWLGLLVVIAMAVTWMASQQDSDDDSDFLGRKAEERDHREGLFYHSTSHNDDPDPRFEDD